MLGSNSATVGASSGPLVVETIANLGDEPFNFNEKAFRFNSTCFGGDRYVCLKAPSAQSDKDPQVGIIDLLEDCEIERRSTRKADGAMKNPFENVLALRGRSEDKDGGHFVQVFNLDNKSKLGDHAFNDEVISWRWLQDRCLIVITTEGIYHWFVRSNADEPETSPTLIFSREGKLREKDIQIINYAVDNEENPNEIQWCVLAGIYLDSKKVIQGCLQLWSVEKQQCQFLEGHAAAFGTLQLDDLALDPSKVFSFVEKKTGISKLFVIDLYSPRGEGKPAPFKVSHEFSYPSDHPNDFPIAEHLSSKYGVAFTVTKAGYVMVFDLKTANRLVCEKVSNENVFLCQPNRRIGGIYLINRKGALVSVTVNDNGLIQYIQAHCNDGLGVALSLAKRYGYPAATEYHSQLHRQFFQNQQYAAAAKICAINKGNTLRTPATLAMFKNAKQLPGEPSPGLQYFSALLNHPGRLAAFEALELMRPVVAQGKRELAVGWLNNDKLQCSEALGDLVRGMDENMALKIYQRANCNQKVIQLYLEKQKFDDVLSFVKKKKHAADYSSLLRSMLTLNAEAAANFTKTLLSSEPPLMDPNVAIDAFLHMKRVNEIIGVLVDVLKSDKADQGYLQTRLFEITFASSSQTAETLFQQELFTHYDRLKIAQLCEKSGMYRRALEHYTEVADIKRVMMKSGGQINIEWLSNFCSSMNPTACLEILTDMLRTNRSNLNAVVQMGSKYHATLGTSNLIKLFDSVNSQDGLFCFLGSIIAISMDSEVHFKYIETAAKIGNWTECERVIKESKSYDPQRVKSFLTSIDLPDPRCLIFLCDIHEFVDELTEYLYRRNKLDYLEVYVTRMNMQATASVVVTLLDLGCNEAKILEILGEVRGACPVEPLIPEFEKRGRLALILPWMEARIEEGMTDKILSNAVAKVYIELGKNPERFLSENVNYDTLEIGRFCEDKDPHMAVTAYMRGQCDSELLNVTRKHGLFRLQAKYLVQRQSPETWKAALSDSDSDSRRSLIDQILATALTEAGTADEIFQTVKAFADAGLNHELMELLERIVIQKSVSPHLVAELTNSAQLQNLLLYTAMQADKPKVKELINKLDKIDCKESAALALTSPVNLCEEAILLFNKCHAYDDALAVIIDRLQDFDRAEKFAEKVNQPSIWLSVASALLNQAETAQDESEGCSLIVKAMRLFLKAEKCPNPSRIIQVAKDRGKLAELAEFLKNCRVLGLSDFLIDSELAYCLAKIEKWTDLESFLSESNNVNLQRVGDQIFDQGLDAEFAGDPEAKTAFKAAKIFYGRIPHHVKLTACHLKLGDRISAIDAAKKAGSAKSWTEVALTAILSKDFQIAHTAGVNVVAYSDHLERLIEAYEAGNHFEELIALLEAGIAGGKTNIALFTELGIAYAKFHPEKLVDFLKSAPVVAAGRLNIPKLIKVCETEWLWDAAVLLYLSYNEYDQAAQVILAHSALTWNRDQMTQILLKVNNPEIAYRAVSFLEKEHPLLLNDMLTALSSKLDVVRVIQIIGKENIGIIQSYLEEEQKASNGTCSTVNETLNEYYIEMNDIPALNRSILNYDNFDREALAKKLEKDSLIEKKKLALKLYEKNRKFAHAVNLALEFRQYSEAIKISAKSKEVAVAESLLRVFAEKVKSRCHFTACLHLCFNLIKPEIALELGWLCGWTEEIMPYMIQTVKDLSFNLQSLEKKVEEHSAKLDVKGKASPPNLMPEFVGLGGMAMLPPGSQFGSGSSAFGLPPATNMLI